MNLGTDFSTRTSHQFSYNLLLVVRCEIKFSASRGLSSDAEQLFHVTE